jgi:hypothetical protein
MRGQSRHAWRRARWFETATEPACVLRRDKFEVQEREKSQRPERPRPVKGKSTPATAKMIPDVALSPPSGAAAV